MTSQAHPKTTLGILRDAASTDPEALALLAPGQEPMRLGEMARQVEAAGWLLRRHGLRAGDPVAVVVPAIAPEATIPIVATMAACCVLGIAADAPAEEMRFLAETAGVRAFVTLAGVESAAAAVAGELGVEVIEMAADPHRPVGALALPEGWTGEEIADPPGPDDWCSIMATSGTTARPRLLARRQRLLAGSMDFAFKAQDRGVTAVLAPMHTAAAWGTVVTTCLSGDAVVFPRSLDPAHILQLLAEYGVTTYTGNPVIHEGLLGAAERAPEVAAACRLRLIFSGGTAVPPAMAAELKRVFRCMVLVGYGMTETNVISAFDPSAVHGKERTAGKPRQPVRVVGEAGDVLGVNDVGEIQVQNADAVEGYLGDAEATLLAVDGDWFRTGDLGFIDDDGYLTITGRKKELINRGTLKVSPLEVEAVLLDHPAVAAVVVFPVPHASRGEDVAAALVSTDPALTADQVRDHAISRLSPHKVPRQVFFVDGIPTSQGKVSRARMAETLGVGRASVRGRGDGAALTPTESVLARTWMEMLGLDGRPAPDDDFFVLGGDSLRAVEMALEAETRLGVRLTPADLLRDASLAGLARTIDAAGTHGPHGAQGPVLVDVQRGNGGTPLVWLHDGVGSIFAAGALAFYLGSGRPVVAIEPAGMGGEGAPPPTVEAMADSYVELLRPLGRSEWIVGGHSFGGMLAVEVARRLEAESAKVPLVFAVESELVTAPREVVAVPSRVQRLRDADWQERSRLVKGFVENRVSPQPVGPRLPDEWHTPPAILETLGQAGQDYRPAPWEGEMLFVKARQSHNPRAAEGWAPVVSRLEIAEVDGDHSGCMREPEVGEVGRILRDRLHELEATG